MKKTILAFSLLASFATVCAQETKKLDSSKAEVKKEVVKKAPVISEKAEEQKMEAEKKAKMLAKEAKLREKGEAKPQ